MMCMQGHKAERRGDTGKAASRVQDSRRISEREGKATMAFRRWPARKRYRGMHRHARAWREVRAVGEEEGPSQPKGIAPSARVSGAWAAALADVPTHTAGSGRGRRGQGARRTHRGDGGGAEQVGHAVGTVLVRTKGHLGISARLARFKFARARAHSPLSPHVSLPYITAYMRRAARNAGRSLGQKQACRKATASLCCSDPHGTSASPCARNELRQSV